MKIQNVKGGYDYLPEEKILRNYITDTLKKVFEEYGYKPIETPILMYFDILSDKYDSNNDILNEIYRLKDQGNRDLGLRYDLTVPFSKLIALNKNKITFPFKRYEISKVFRDGPVKIGRDREFTQCDVDVVGIDNQFIEAELITLYFEAFKRLDIDIIVKYNSRKLMNGILLESRINEDLIPEVTTIIDKLDKLSEIEFTISLNELGINEEQIYLIKENFNLTLSKLNNKYKNTKNEQIILGLQEVNNLKKLLKELGIDKNCIFSPTLARGQNYYTGNVFEVYDKNKTVTGSIGAGGRYDKIITNFINDGNIYPTVGISFGLSPIFEVLKRKNSINNINQIDFYIIPMDTQVESLKLANSLRNLGYKVDIEMQNKKLKKSLDFANKEKIPYVVIFGQDEISRKSFEIKDMNSSTSIKVKFEDIENIPSILSNK